MQYKCDYNAYRIAQKAASDGCFAPEKRLPMSGLPPARKERQMQQIGVNCCTLPSVTNRVRSYDFHARQTPETGMSGRSRWLFANYSPLLLPFSFLVSLRASPGRDVGMSWPSGPLSHYRARSCRD